MPVQFGGIGTFIIILLLSFEQLLTLAQLECGPGLWGVLEWQEVKNCPLNGNKLQCADGKCTKGG